MDERAALAYIADALDGAGDDAAVVDGAVLTTDMLHETTDFPEGTTRYTAGWRAVGASLSDLAAMGARARAAVAVYGDAAFEREQLAAFLDGASTVCERVGAEYVGGDLDGHEEFTVATTALGAVEDPVRRSGAEPGDRICVTGTLGRSAAALRLFPDDPERANDLFRFEPRVAAGQAIAEHATAMMDSSDGLVRSVHQLAEASRVGVSLRSTALPVDDALRDVAPEEAVDLAAAFGEDFELVCTVPEGAVATVREASPVPLTVVGEVTDGIVAMDGDPLEDRGYTH
jgi:thiamine-monophosphate kinase